MLGEVPICVISPPSKEANAIGIRNVEGEVLERRANWNAIGIMIARAPMFFTKADRTATVTTSTASWARTEDNLRCVALDGEFHDAAARHAGADQQRAADDDDDVVAETGECLFQRNDADGKCGKQRQGSDEIVAQPAPDERCHHQHDDGEGEQLGQCEHGNSQLDAQERAMRNFVAGGRTRSNSAKQAAGEERRERRCPASRGSSGCRRPARPWQTDGRRRNRASPDRRQKAPGREAGRGPPIA